MLTYQRRKKIKTHDFVSLNHAAALKEAQAYLTQHYDLHHTVVLSNADGGAGYQQADFDDLVGKCQRHEHLLNTNFEAELPQLRQVFTFLHAACVANRLRTNYSCLMELRL